MRRIRKAQENDRNAREKLSVHYLRPSSSFRAIPGAKTFRILVNVTQYRRRYVVYVQKERRNPDVYNT